MNVLQKRIDAGDFCIFVVSMLAGGLGGWLTAIAFSNRYWWVGLSCGLLVSALQARWYTKFLARRSAKGEKGMELWAGGTFVGAVLGLLCITIIQCAMLLVVHLFSSPLDVWMCDGRVFALVEFAGAFVGLVVGGICSIIYF